MELSEVYNEASEEKVCMLRDKFDSLRWKLSDRVKNGEKEMLFMKLLKKIASFEKTEDALRFLVDALAKLEMKKIDDMSTQKEDGTMSFISVVIGWNGWPSNMMSEEAEELEPETEY